jgi:hypothetical protein
VFHDTQYVLLLILIPLCSADPAIIIAEETGPSIGGTTTIIDQEGGTDLETADMETENDPRIDDEDEVESEITVTGETILMTGHEGAARTLLTHGPVAEEKIPVGNLQAGQNLPNQPRSVHILSLRRIQSLMYLHRHLNPLLHLRRARPTRKPSGWQS